MYRLSLAFFCICSLHSSDFITQHEYAQMLYKNPRGIGCSNCHGAKGEGGLLGKYKNINGDVVELKAPPINEISRESFYKSFKKRGSVMPSYFLTEDEKESLYLYITGQL